MRSLLDHQADGIEYTLHSHGIAASVAGGNISPRLIQFHIKLEAGTKYSRVLALADELALALGVNHCRITREGYMVKVEVPRLDPVAVQLFPLMRNLPGELPENAPVLGLDENGVPLLVRLSSPDIAHMLICGTSGSGKTVLARSMIASLALQNPPESLRLLLIDPKGRGYSNFSGLPNLICPVVTDALDGLHRLRWAVRHIEKREEQGTNSPALVIFIDEMAELAAVNGRELEQAVAQLVQRGCEVGIHLIACTQRLTPYLTGVARQNWPTRAVGRMLTPEEARIASAVAGSGAERLIGQGDFLLFAKGEATRLQAAHISVEEIEQTVTHLGGVPGEVEVNRANQSQRQPLRGKQATQSPEQEEEYKVKPQRTVAKRNFRQSAATSYQEQEAQPLGVAERLAEYQENIQRRRRKVSEEAETEQESKAETEYPYYNPARAQQESRQAKPTRSSRPPDKWEDQEDLNQNDSAPSRSQANGPTRRQPGPAASESDEEARNIMNSLKKTGLMNINKISS